MGHFKNLILWGILFGLVTAKADKLFVAVGVSKLVFGDSSDDPPKGSFSRCTGATRGQPALISHLREEKKKSSRAVSKE
jgi:hypothetical protein